MKKYLILFFLLLPFAYVYARYLMIPNHPFLVPPPGSIQSTEPADTEDPLRRAYFTNYTREQVIAHYTAQLAYLPVLRLNYPPEEAKFYIRDQTRSWYLEELVHPLRSSVFINGYIPQTAEYTIYVDGVQYAQKITLRQVPSSRPVRILVYALIPLCVGALLIEWKRILLSR